MANITHITSGVSTKFRTTTQIIYYRKKQTNKQTNIEMKKKKEKENIFTQPQHQTNLILKSCCIEQRNGVAVLQQELKRVVLELSLN